MSPPPRMIDVLAGGVDRRAIECSLADEVRSFQVLHREVDPAKRSAGQFKVSRTRRTDGDHDRVKFARRAGPPAPPAGRQDAPRLRLDLSDAHPRLKPRAFGFHLGDPTVDHPLLELEFGDAVTDQPARALRAFEHRDRVPDAGELLRSGESGRTRADDRHPTIGRDRRAHRFERSGRPLRDLEFDLFDRYWFVGEAEHARTLARRGAQPAGELGKVVRGVQTVRGAPPVACATRSFHSGMRFPSGQPSWQKGIPQLMQRVA